MTTADPGADPASGRVHSFVEAETGWILLDNPARRNAMSFAMWQGLAETLDRFESDAAVRCVVLRGAGDLAFCAGADISEFGGAAPDAYNRLAMAAMARLQQITKPTLAMISGYCIGGGTALAVSCDIRIASRTSRYGIPAAKLGLGYDYDGARRLTALIGPSPTKRLLFSAAQIGAEEALRIGLIDEIAEPADLEAAVRGLSGTIARNAPLSVVAAKLAVDASWNEPDAAGLAELQGRIAACYASEDFIEGQRAFAEKRAARFAGR